MKLSDYVIELIADSGVKHVFMLPGGGAMHLNDSLGNSKRLKFICNLHEQACAVAADAYSQYTNNIGVCLVTTGPGSTNTITGVAAAWMDSIPILVISGQVKRIDSARGKGVRQMGFQEIDIVSIVSSITKYAVTVIDPQEIRYHMEKALWLARNGRPGPCWIDIPLDVQAAQIDPEKLKVFDPEKEGLIQECNRQWLSEKVKETLQLLKLSSRPVILAGNGIRLAKAHKDFLLAARKLNVPVLTTWKALDFLPEDDPLFIGRPGLVAQRAANLAQQKSDWLLMLGARMDLGQTAYMHKYLAPNAKKIMVNIDENEIKKMQTRIDIPMPIDVGIFIREILLQLKDFRLDNNQWDDWWKQCRAWKIKYQVVLPEYWEYEDGVSIYALTEAIAETIQPGDLFAPGSSGAAGEVTMQCFKAKQGVQVFNSEGLGSMGFGIAAALGGCVASGGKRTVCVEGDGGFAMNTQELETIRRLKLPIKFFVLDNQGYASIRATQKTYFESRFYASSKEGGLTLPDIKKISQAHGISYIEMNSSKDIKSVTAKVFETDGAIICRVKVSPRQITAPRVTSRLLKDGSMETAPMEQMWPELNE
jgi:acetolactate synthase-1/2/3 large subunit